MSSKSVTPRLRSAAWNPGRSWRACSQLEEFVSVIEGWTPARCFQSFSRPFVREDDRLVGCAVRIVEEDKRRLALPGRAGLEREDVRLGRLLEGDHDEPRLRGGLPLS